MNKTDLVMETVLLAGKIMIENGSDMARVDETLKRIVHNSGIGTPRIFETTTGLIMSVQGTNESQVQPINKRRIDLERISRVNDASRAFQSREITLEEMYRYLEELDKSQLDFNPLLKILAAGIIGGTLEVIYGGQWSDMILTMIISSLGYGCYSLLEHFSHTLFASEFIAAVLVGVCGVFITSIHVGKDMSMIIIGGIMPLVPGVLLTTAVRDLLAGHILSGASRIIEGLITACALGMGIAVVLRFI